MKFPFETVLSKAGEDLKIYEPGAKVIVLGYPNNISDLWPVTIISKYGTYECNFTPGGYTNGMKGCFIEWPKKKNKNMKNYIVKINYSYESFSGYDHNDGDKEFKVLAKNNKSARNKALKLAEKEGGGYERRVISVREN